MAPDKSNPEKDYPQLDYAKFMEEVDRRRAEIVRLRQKKWTLQQIGDKFQISAERVRQVLESAKKRNEFHEIED